MFMRAEIVERCILGTHKEVETAAADIDISYCLPALPQPDKDVRGDLFGLFPEFYNGQRKIV